MKINAYARRSLMAAALGAVLLSGSAVADSRGHRKDHSPPAPVAATGQTTSYAFGDDGDFQSGVTVKRKRFRENGDGTFTDRLTGITWLGIRECLVNRDWFGALEYANDLSARSDLCPGLNDGSVAGDWKVPNVKELFSLVDISEDTALFSGNPVAPPTFPDAPPGSNYWTSSSFRPQPEVLGWAVDANFGRPFNYAKENIGGVWPMRVGH